MEQGWITAIKSKETEQESCTCQQLGTIIAGYNTDAYKIYKIYPYFGFCHNYLYFAAKVGVNSCTFYYNLVHGRTMKVTQATVGIKSCTYT